MSRPNYITAEQIESWNESIQKELLLPTNFKEDPKLLEITYAGLWLAEELFALGCDPTLIFQFQYTHAQMSQDSDTWEQAESLLNSYRSGDFVIEEI